MSADLVVPEDLPLPEPGGLPPGPACLRFLDTDGYKMLAAAVAAANVAILGTETMMGLQHIDMDSFQHVEKYFLCGYAIDVALRLALWQQRFFVGRCCHVWWNWTDLFVVAAGVLEMVLEDHPVLTLLWCLRFLRASRVLHWFSAHDASWIQSEKFQAFMMCVIIYSSLQMGFECDMPGLPIYPFLEHGTLAIFSVELLLRLKYWRMRFFCHPKDTIFNCFDFCIVVSGVVAQWAIPGWGALCARVYGEPNERERGSRSALPLLQMLRLVRVLRLVRLIRTIPALFTLIQGITSAMAGMLWVLVFTAVLLYASSLVAVKLLRDGLMYGGEAPDDVVSLFDTVPNTFFVLFLIMNGDFTMLDPVFDTIGSIKPLFASFVVMLSWIMLSILTAVVSEKMLAVSEVHRDEREEEEKKEKSERKANQLNEVFNEMDLDGEGSVERDEFESMLLDDEMSGKVCKITGLEHNELTALFGLLGKDAIIRRDDFIRGFESSSRLLTERSVMRFEKTVDTVEALVRRLRAQVGSAAP